MARICVVGNATQDLNRTGLFSRRRPGGTLLYASLALQALGHEVHPIGHAPLKAYFWLRRAGLDVGDVHVAFPGTQFLNEYDGEERRQWARRGPQPALRDAQALSGNDGVLLGPVLGEVPADLVVPEQPVSLLDIQGSVRELGSPNLLAWREVRVRTAGGKLPGADYVRGSLEEASAITGEGDPVEAAQALHEHTGAVAVVTLASRGAVAYDGELHRATPEPLDVEDPTGAGDVFDAGLLHGLLGGRGLDQALALACAAAGVFLGRDWDGDPTERFGVRDVIEEQADRVRVD